MGLCREKVEDRSIDLEGTNSREKVEDLRVDLEGRNIHLIMPVDRCVEHQDTIRKCMFQEGKYNGGNLGTRQLFVLFVKMNVC